MEPPLDGETKVCSTGTGHMTAMSIYIYMINTQKVFSGTKSSMSLKVGVLHWVFDCCKICTNDDPGMTLKYFTAQSQIEYGENAR